MSEPEVTTRNRLHPLSIPYRIAQTGAGIVPLLFVLAFASGPVVGQVGVLARIVLLLAGAMAVVAWQVAYYRRFAYETTSDTFDIRSGVVSRRNREIPYGRVQNVDISRNVVQRALDIAELRIETAGGSETEATLRYVGYEEAKRLQNELRRRKRRTERDDAVDEPESERLLYAISPPDLAVLSIASFDLRLVSFLSVLLSIVAPSVIINIVTGLPINPLVVVGLVIVGVVVGSAIISGANAVVNTYGFRLTRAGDELRYERGLIQRFDGSIPLDKVQTLALRENLLKRLFGYSTLVVETAGYAPGQGGGVGSESAIPIARRDRTREIAREIEPFGGYSFRRPPKRARNRYAIRYLIALGVLGGLIYGVTLFTGVEPYWPVLVAGVAVVPVAAHLKWACRGYYAGEDYAIVRNGFWQQTVHVVPYYRVQTVIETRTVFQRRWRIATATIDTAGSSGLTGADAQAIDLDEDDATEFRETVATRLQESLIARARDADERRVVGRETDRNDADADDREPRADVAASDSDPERNDSDERSDPDVDHDARQSGERS